VAKFDNPAALVAAPGDRSLKSACVETLVQVVKSDNPLALVAALQDKFLRSISAEVLVI
jgi:hypothetical protein